MLRVCETKCGTEMGSGAPRRQRRRQQRRPLLPRHVLCVCLCASVSVFLCVTGRRGYTATSVGGCKGRSERGGGRRKQGGREEGRSRRGSESACEAAEGAECDPLRRKGRKGAREAGRERGGKWGGKGGRVWQRDGGERKRETNENCSTGDRRLESMAAALENMASRGSERVFWGGVLTARRVVTRSRGA
eukprot:2204251-Rhodomonas_salina.1